MAANGTRCDTQSPQGTRAARVGPLFVTLDVESVELLDLRLTMIDIPPFSPFDVQKTTIQMIDDNIGNH
jgi:hypothetical protein